MESGWKSVRLAGRGGEARAVALEDNMHFTDFCLVFV